MSTIVKLEAQNIKRLKAVNITPEGNVVVIRGNNAAGKTSVLDAIEMALGGKTSIPGRPVRDGETEAHIVLETTELVIERKWTSNETSYLEVRSHAGAKFPSPQKKLDELVGALSFDPLGFMRMKPTEKAETVRKLVGLDFSKEDAERKRVFDERTMVNRDAAALAARIGPAVAKVEPIDMKTALGEVDALEAKLASARARRDRIVKMEHDLEQLEAERLDLREKLDSVEARMLDRRQSLEIDRDASPDNADGVAEKLFKDVKAAKAFLADVEAINAKARAYTDRAALEVKHKAEEAKALALSESIVDIDRLKAEKLAAATFPVAGMSLGEGVLTFNGVPIEQASAAEQLIVSVKMGLALNPKLRVLLVRDGSLLDANSLATLGRLAAEANAQVWLEMVGKDGAGVVIEDGSVEEVRS